MRVSYGTPVFFWHVIALLQLTPYFCGEHAWLVRQLMLISARIAAPSLSLQKLGFSAPSDSTAT